MPHHEWATMEMRDVAGGYASQQHWPVLPGHFHDRYGCSCGDSRCDVPDPHPLRDLASATLDAGTIETWWEQDPFPVLLPTGEHFDVLDVPGRPGRESLLRLELLGYELGPLVQSGTGRILIWIMPGSRLPRPPGSPWLYEGLGIRHHGAGDFVVAPPSCGARWLNGPAVTTAQLPRVADLLGTLACACRQAQEECLVQAVPMQRIGNQLEERPA
jgi:Bifunctional DNA primase/polymerase, N-terminal